MYHTCYGNNSKEQTPMSVFVSETIILNCVAIAKMLSPGTEKKTFGEYS